MPLRTTWHVTRHIARDKRPMCCTWFAHDCVRTIWAYVLGDGSRRSEEIAKNLELRLWMWLLYYHYNWTHSTPMSLYADIVIGLLARRPQHMHVVSWSECNYFLWQDSRVRNTAAIFVITIVLSVHNFFASEPNFQCASFCFVVLFERFCLITFKHWEQLGMEWVLKSGRSFLKSKLLSIFCRPART